jgi:hypothetical protein
LAAPSHQFALVVESSDSTRLKLADVLVSRGYVVHTCPNADAASGLTQEVAFGLIVIGVGQVIQAPAIVRALLRQEGLRQAVVFHDSKSGGVTEGFAPGVLVELAPRDDIAARLRMLVPMAHATDRVKKKGDTGKHRG